MASAARRAVSRVTLSGLSRLLCHNPTRQTQARSFWAFNSAAPVNSSGHVEWDYRSQRRALPVYNIVPYIAVDAYVAPNTVIAGAVDVWDASSVWYGSVVRGDLNKITINFAANVQDRCVIHAAKTSPTGLPAETDIGKYVTVGAFSTLRSCVIEDEVIIGQRCVLMEGSLVETNAILMSGTVLAPGRRIPAGELWGGNPARFIRQLTYDETHNIKLLAEKMRTVAKMHMSEFLPYSTAYLEAEKLKKSLMLPA
ncbi:hypothetical protein GOP47_0028214 [Adiantum capillus-veneris]|nr:hypothetical protein GOP47_0028214 [Adiantum capillus-veneris]